MPKDQMTKEKLYPRYAVAIEVWDNKHKFLLVSEGFSTDSIDHIINKLKDLAFEIERRNK